MFTVRSVVGDRCNVRSDIYFSVVICLLDNLIGYWITILLKKKRLVRYSITFPVMTKYDESSFNWLCKNVTLG